MEFSRFITMSLADNVHLVARDRMVRKVLHNRNWFGREEDIDLLWSIQSK
jgi:hypothetical protein